MFENLKDDQNEDFGERATRAALRWLGLYLAGAALFLLALSAIKTFSGYHLRAQEPHIVAIDGDTLDYHGQRIRLAGVDAFELGQECRITTAEKDADGMIRNRSGFYDCGLESKRAMEMFIRYFGPALTCTWAAGNIDVYGRPLATCMAALPSATIDLAAAMAFICHVVPSDKESAYFASYGAGKALGKGFCAPNVTHIAPWKWRKGTRWAETAS